jgi:threonine dehydratase
VATHSSGNHAAALARAARLRGIPAYIVMPEDSNRTKLRAVEDYRGQITLCASNARAREAACADVVARTGAELVHPFADFRVMAGQATAVVELLEDQPELDVVICPVGGGGLLSGTAVAAHALNPAIRIVAAEPAGADDAAQSLASGRRVVVDEPHTIADGLRTSIGEPNFAVIREHVHQVVTVTDAEIVAAMRLLWETLKIIVEPSAAVAFAAAQKDRSALAGHRVGLILTGGNVDLDALPWRAK